MSRTGRTFAVALALIAIVFNATVLLWHASARAQLNAQVIGRSFDRGDRRGLFNGSIGASSGQCRQ